MEGIDFHRDAVLSLPGWASWDFHPSPWNGGTLIAHCADDPDSPFLGLAAPGVSLCGESGFETARWRRAEWSTVREFLAHGEPQRFETVELECIRMDLPDDFDEWAARATAAHIDRLRSFDLHNSQESEAAHLADLLHVEMEDAYPGVLERLWTEYRVPRFEETEVQVSFARRSLERVSRHVSPIQALDLVGQAIGFGVLYGLYRLVREPWAPRGEQVGLEGVLQMPIGEFALWLYGMAHVALPAAFLGWVYFRRHDSFALARNAMVLAIVFTVGAYLLYSPGAVYAGGFSESVPANALPTMPALHLAVALGLAYFGIRLTRGLTAKALWAAYPLVVALVVLISGSRYPLPTIAFAVAMMAASVYLADRLVPRLWLPINVFGRRRRGPAGAREPR